MSLIKRSESNRNPSAGAYAVIIRSFRDHLFWVLGIFLIGLGAKLWLIARSGTSLPFWDAWDGEADRLYLPFLEGRLSLYDLFRGHSEHRILFTRLYDLALLALNGEWDNQMETVANAILHSMGIACFGWLMARLMGKQHWPFIWPPLVLALVLPFAWDNTLWGFQSQFYFLLFLSLLTIWLLGLSAPWSFRWWLGATVATAALFTMGSGFLAAAAVAALTVLEVLKQKASWRKHLPTLVVCASIIIAGFLLMEDVPVHHVLQAHSITEFAISLGNNLAWPWIVLPPFAFCNLLPLLLLGWIYLTSREEPSAAEKMILGTGVWVCLQCAAAAYARGAGGAMPAWRYMDTSSFILITGCLSTVLLLTRYRQRLRPSRFWWGTAAAAWGLICVAGLWFLCARALQLDIPERKFYERVQLRTTRSFMITDDVHTFLKKPVPELPYPDVEKLAGWLRNAQIRRILPACVREPVKVFGKQASDNAFDSPGCVPADRNQPAEPCWASCSRQGANERVTFESLSIQPVSLPYLEFQVTGQLGNPGLALELIDLTTGQRIPVRPPTIGQRGWVNVCVKAPVGPFKIAAHGDGSAQWFAFRQPRELGRLSFYATKLLAAWPGFIFAGLACSLTGLALMVIRKK